MGAKKKKETTAGGGKTSRAQRAKAVSAQGLAAIFAPASAASSSRSSGM
jgi:hypothetical protein